MSSIESTIANIIMPYVYKESNLKPIYFMLHINSEIKIYKTHDNKYAVYRRKKPLFKTINFNIILDFITHIGNSYFNNIEEIMISINLDSIIMYAMCESSNEITDFMKRYIILMDCERI